MLGSPVILWVVLLVLFLVIEASTVALVTIWFAAGAGAALLLCLLGAPYWAQILGFLAVSAALLAMLRPVMRKTLKSANTNVDSIIGSMGLVTADIDNVQYTGEVRIGAMTWTARSTGEEFIPAGTRVRVDRIEGVKVFVTPVKEPES